MQVLGRELTTDEIIRFVRDFAAQTRRHKDCHDCLYIDMALALADEVERLNRRAAPENKALTLEELTSTIENEPNGWLWLEALTDSRESLYQRNEITYRWSNITNYGKTWLAYARRPDGGK